MNGFSRSLVVVRSLLRGSWFLAALWVPFTADSLLATGERTQFRFVVQDTSAPAGQPIVVQIDGDHAESAQGFTMAFRYPSDDLAISRVHIEDTILEAIEVEFVDVRIVPDLLGPARGAVSVGVLVDSRPPFDGRLIPDIGQPLAFLYVEGQVSEDAVDDVLLTFEDGMFSPPIKNSYSVNNQTIPVTELTPGRITVLANEMFLRGDANGDGGLDVADPITVLNYQFVGIGQIECMNAADANDDDRVNLADALFVLNYLFLSGPALPEPGLRPGFDPTPGNLTCESPPF